MWVPSRTAVDALGVDDVVDGLIRALNTYNVDRRCEDELAYTSVSLDTMTNFHGDPVWKFENISNSIGLARRMATEERNNDYLSEIHGRGL
jgi:hypothetical protein